MQLNPPGLLRPHLLPADAAGGAAAQDTGSEAYADQLLRQAVGADDAQVSGA